MPIHLPAVCAIAKRGARIAGGSGTGGNTMIEIRRRRRFRPLAVGLFGALLPLALSSTAQTPALTANSLQPATAAQSPTAPLPYRTSLPASSDVR